jgi:WD40 repeat protein
MNDVAFNPDATLVAAAGFQTVLLWETANGTLMAPLPDQAGRVWSATFNPDGTLVASASEDGTVRVWG